MRLLPSRYRTLGNTMLSSERCDPFPELFLAFSVTPAACHCILQDRDPLFEAEIESILNGAVIVLYITPKIGRILCQSLLAFWLLDWET